MYFHIVVTDEASGLECYDDSELRVILIISTFLIALFRRGCKGGLFW